MCFNNVRHSFLEPFIIVSLKPLTDISNICAILGLLLLGAFSHVAEIFLVLHTLSNLGWYPGHFEYYKAFGSYLKLMRMLMFLRFSHDTHYSATFTEGGLQTRRPETHS